MLYHFIKVSQDYMARPLLFIVCINTFSCVLLTKHLPAYLRPQILVLVQNLLLFVLVCSVKIVQCVENFYFTVLWKITYFKLTYKLINNIIFPLKDQI